MTFTRTSSASLAALLAVAALGAASSPLDSLVRAERDFARLSVERGMQIAFDANFADDGIWFSPHPEKTREALARRPRTKRELTLDWFPTFSDVSAAGDLGYNTGPWVLSSRTGQTRPSEHGYFFSVWKRQADGAWKVAVDFGIDVPGPSATETAASWRHARSDLYKPRGEVLPVDEGEAVRRREKELAQAVSSRGLPAAYAASLAGDFRVYRNDNLPLSGLDALTRRLRSEQERGQLTWEPTSVEVARSADLAYSWGTYSLAAKAAAEPLEKGYYVHVWRRSSDGRWRLAIEIMRPLPPSPPAGTKVG